jgi:hypothetical protein
MSHLNEIVKYKKFTLMPIVTDGKPGKLVDLDINNICIEHNFLFTISKCFYIYDLDSKMSRGNHSNSNASEILICLKGSFEIKLHDGKEEQKFSMNQNEGIFIDKNIWIEFYDFKDSIIMAFVNILPNEKNSCYDFNDFLSMTKNE